MLKSRQRIGDDPRDYDGHFQPPSDEHADVSGIRPDVANLEIDAAKSQSQPNLFEPWSIYPKPAPPHWHWKDHETVVSIDGIKSSGHDKFNFDDCTIPGEHPGWSFGIDVKGVFQVYDDNNKGNKVIVSFYTD
jgi:AMP deaminase